MPSSPALSSSPSNPRTLLLRRILGFSLLIIVAAAPLLHLHIIKREMPANHNDLLPRWVGTRAALHGQDPYSAYVTGEIQTAYYGRPLMPGEDVDPQDFAYPAYVVVLLAPLTLLSLNTAPTVFLCVVAPALAGTFFLCVQFLNIPVTRARSALIAAVAFCSWPVMWALRLQQLTLPVAALTFAACFLLKREKETAAGVLLALAMIKPQLVLPLVAWLLVWAYIRHLWSFIVSFGLTFTLLLLCAERIVPNWFPHWRNSLHRYGLHTELPLKAYSGIGSESRAPCCLRPIAPSFFGSFGAARRVRPCSAWPSLSS